jgi:nucleotidyltransferase AbiEii toxin of type IV toxin-antitoxin system
MPPGTVTKRGDEVNEGGDSKHVLKASTGLPFGISLRLMPKPTCPEPPTTLPWTEVALESLPDLVTSKMFALVEHGAPRDFRDVYALCHAGLMSPRDCWQLWKERHAGNDTDPHRAWLAVETHLARIAVHRPLSGIADLDRRAEAERVRSWFKEEFLHVLLD